MLPNRLFRALSAPLVEIESQVLRQQVQIVGVPFRLSYRSDRVPGRKAESTISIPLTGKKIARRVKQIVVELEIAGRRVIERFEPKPELRYTFRWDGNDATGSPQPLTIRIGTVQR